MIENLMQYIYLHVNKMHCLHKFVVHLTKFGPSTIKFVVLKSNSSFVKENLGYEFKESLFVIGPDRMCNKMFCYYINAGIYSTG